MMRIAVADGDVSADDGFKLMNAMADSGRSLTLPSSPADLLR
jgi:hypothetical protein